MSNLLEPGQTFVSFDVETNGTIPGVFSMLSLGAVAFNHEGNELSRFQVNIKELPDARQDHDTMLWWKKQGEDVWAAIRKDVVNAVTAMRRFDVWTSVLPGRLVPIAYPASWDWMFLYWYMIRFNGNSPFGFQCLDMKTLAAQILDLPFRSISKSVMPKSWFDPTLKHTHIPMDDAAEQGHLFFSMVCDGKKE